MCTKKHTLIKEDIVMEIEEFRSLLAETKIDPNKSAEKIVENEQKIYSAVMSLSFDSDDGEEVITEVLNLLLEFPAVLQLLRLMAREPQRSSQNSDFSITHALFPGVKNQ